MVRVELACTTSTMLHEISHKEITQRSVALTYALSIMSSDVTDWPKVNQAIIERWSFSGLERVKRMAWKHVERKK